MGRLRQWIDRLTTWPHAPGRALGVDGSPRTRGRRALGFERYETRIALSADTPALGADDVVLFWSSDGVWRDYFANLVATSAPIATFDGANELEPFHLSIHYDLSSFQIALPVPSGQWDGSLASMFLNDATPGEGGVIGLDSMFADAATSVSDADVFHGTLNSAFDGTSGGDSLNFGSIVSRFLGADIAGQLPSLVLARENGGFGVGFFRYSPAADGVDGGLVAVLDSGVTLNQSEMIRIVLPPSQPDGEGGAINLAAMLGPNSLIAAGSSAAIATARPTAPPPRTALGDDHYAASENLRARAVVYNVALVDEAGGSPTLLSPAHEAQAADSATDGGESASRGRAAASRHSEPVERRATQHDSESTPADAEQAALNPRAATPDAAAPQEGAAATAPVAADNKTAAAFDAAFGSWDDELSPLESEASDGVLSLTGTREHTLVGLAVAAAIGAPAVIRRTRRPKSNPAPEQAAGLR